MRTLLVLIAITVVGCDSGAKKKPPPSPVLPPAIDLAVKMTRTTCYGTCPAYTVAISKDGAVTFTGEDYVAAKHGTRTISTDVVRGLGALADAAHFFDLRDHYVSDGCTEVATDNPTTTITITRGGKTKSVERYHGCDGVPPALDQLADSIDLAAGTAEWIGTGDQRKAM